MPTKAKKKKTGKTPPVPSVPKIPLSQEATGDGRRNSRKGTSVLWPLDKIKIGTRYRKDLGDIRGLMESIKAVGLLHPVVVAPDGTLVAGYRRLYALLKLGWTEIPATVARTVEDARKFLLAQRDEDTQRKNLTAIEAARLRQALRPYFQEEAEKRRIAGKSSDGCAGGRGRKKNLRENCAEVSRGRRADEEASAGTGYSSRTLDAVEEILQKAEANPELFQPVVDQLQQTNKVHPAVRRMKEIEKDGLHDGKSAASRPPAENLKIRYRSSKELGNHLVKALLKLSQEFGDGGGTPLEKLRRAGVAVDALTTDPTHPPGTPDGDSQEDGGIVGDGTSSDDQHRSSDKTDTQDAAQEAGLRDEEEKEQKHGEPATALDDHAIEDPPYEIIRKEFWRREPLDWTSAADLTEATGLPESELTKLATKYDDIDKKVIDGQAHFRLKEGHSGGTGDLQRGVDHRLKVPGPAASQP